MSDDSARAVVLSRIHAALAASPALASDAPELEAAVELAALAHPPAAANLPRTELMELFAERLADYGASVYRCAPGTLHDALRHALTEVPVRSLLLPRNFVLEPASAHTLQELAIEPVPDNDLSPAELERCDAVLTGCTVTIASTGSVVLQGGTREGRRVCTLLPDRHICIVHETQIVPGVVEAMAVLAAQPASPTTFFSGPSATADIEMTRIKGVHGPRFVSVLLVAEP